MKRMQWKVGWFLFLFNGFILGCSHSKIVSKEVPQIPDFLQGRNFKQITTAGDNDHPRFSADGTRLLFTSSSRPTHKGQQIYEIDLLTNKERRVVFSDGDAFDASYIGNSELIYSSTTDAIKENPLAYKEIPKDYPPSDLYMSDLYGSDILRLTTLPDFQGEAAFLSNPTRPFIVFTSRQNNVTGIYRLDLRDLPISVISSEKNKEKRYPVITFDQKNLVWIEKDLQTGLESLILYNIKTKKTSVLKSDDGDYKDLFFAPRGPERLFYSVRPKGKKTYQLEVYDLKNQCSQVVLQGSDSLFSPAVSDDSVERLSFSRLFEGKKQIYVMDLPSELGACVSTSTQATLKE
ncbi:MAG: TolB family protein [Pseudobdellovibrionaceae bacterium]